MNRVHTLKTWPEYFQAVFDGRKTFEIRNNDRDFHVGDFLNLIEWDPDSESFTGREISAKVTYMTDFEQKDGFVVLGIRALIGICFSKE